MALHVDYQVRWKNYRGFRDTGWIVFKPLTLLIGPNNAGKTSITAPLLLLAQTMRSQEGKSALVTRGDLADVGSYSALINEHNDKRDLYLGFKFHVHESNEKRSAVKKYPPGIVELTFGLDKKQKQIIEKQYKLSDIYGTELFEIKRNTRGNEIINWAKRGKFSPAELVAIRDTPPMNFLFTPGATLYQLRKGQDRDARGKRNFPKHFQPILRYRASAQKSFEEFLIPSRMLGRSVKKYVDTMT